MLVSFPKFFSACSFYIKEKTQNKTKCNGSILSQVTGLLLSDSSKISAMVDVGDCKPAAEKLLDELNEFKLICQVTKFAER